MISPSTAEPGWDPDSYHGFSTRVLSLKQAVFKVCIFPSTSSSLCTALPLLCSLLSTRIILVLEELTVALCNCQAVWLLVSSFKEETWACKYSSLRYDYALDHSSYRHLPTICFVRAGLINEARSMRRETLGDSCAVLKYLI